MVEKASGELVSLVDIRSNRELVNPRFIASIIISVLAISIISLLILSFPIVPSRVDTLSETDFSNFFYQWTYRFVDRSQYDQDSYYQFEGLFVDVGYSILMPFFVVLTFLSGSMILLKTRKETKIAIFINWGLYLIPIILVIIKAALVNNIRFTDWNDEMILGTLSVYSLCYLPNQILLLVNKSTFREWFGFTSKADNVMHDKFIKEIKIINLILNCLVLIYLIYIPIVPIRFFNKLVELPYRYIDIDGYNFFINPNSIINGIIFSSILLIYGLTFTKFLDFKRVPSMIVALATPYVLFFMIYASTYFSTYSFFMDDAFDFGDLGVISYIDFLISYLFYASMFLLLSIPAGFYSKKKDYLIIAAVNSIVLIIFMILFITRNLRHETFFYDSYNTTKKILYSLLYPFMIGIVFLGALWGKFLRWRYDKLFESSSHQLNISIDKSVLENKIQD